MMAIIGLAVGAMSFNTLCRVLIGCYVCIDYYYVSDMIMFQYPLSGLNRLLLCPLLLVRWWHQGFNTLCRVLIGCY